MSDHNYEIIYEDPPWRFQNWSMAERAVRGEKWGRANGRSPYDCMTHEDLLSLPIGNLCSDVKDCVRFTWVTFPKLAEAIEYINKDNLFSYRTCAFVWVKLNKQFYRTFEKKWKEQLLTLPLYPNQEEEFFDRLCDNLLNSLFFFGTGFWTHSNVELCLLSKKGNPSREGKDVSQLILESDPQDRLLIEPIEGHSRKPAIVRDKIVRLCGNKKRIELFAREPDGVPGWTVTGLESDGVLIHDFLNGNTPSGNYPIDGSGILVGQG